MTYDAARALRNDLDALLKLADAPAPAPVPVPVPPPVVAPVKGKVKLILHPHPGQSPTATPDYIKANAAFLKSLPFDGMSVYLRDVAMAMNATATINTSAPVTVDQLRGILAPLAGIGMPNNFAFVLGATPPDFFADWSVVVQNWRNLATVCREVGIAGILFDNEQYSKPWGDYQPAMGRTLEQFQNQAKLRGMEIMRAVGDLPVIHLHGPYVSRNDAPAPLFPQWQSANELLGPLFEGFLNGAADKSKAVDGGEIYHLRSAAEFKASYDWRKKNWPGASISFGVFDVPFGGAPMNAAILGTTIGNALKTADQWVWFYPEGASYLVPTAPVGMVAAIRAGKMEGA